MAMAMGLLLLSGLISGQDARTQTPREQYDSLLKQYESARQGYSKASKEAGNDEERRKLAIEKRSRVMGFAERFFELAEEYPGDPVAFDALATVVNERFMLNDEVRALEALTRDHVRAKELGKFCIRMRWMSRTPAWAKAKAWLGEVIEKNPHPDVQALACFCLASFDQDHAEIARYLRRNPTESRQPFFRAMLGEAGAMRLLESQPNDLDGEAEELFSLIIEKYQNIDSEIGNLADLARGRLFAIRHLSIGSVVPDIEGEDIDGRPMKLSDHRGKVLVINFWATWCGPCMALVPEERLLVERLKSRPFMLIGINCDEDRKAAKAATEKEGMSWPSFWDGAPSNGRIVNTWGIHAWPTIYVIDTKGIIRFKNLGFPNKERFEVMVDLLLKE